MLLIVAIAGLAWAFVYIREAVMTLFLSLFLALVLEPVVRLMQRKLPLGRGACATTLILGLTALAVVFTLLLLSPLAGTFRDFVEALPGMVEDITTNSSFGSWLDTHSSAPETAQANVKEIAQGIAGAAGGVIGIIISGFSLVLALVTAIFLTLFLMIDLPRLIGAVDTLLDPRGSDRWTRMSERIITAVSRTMLGNIAISIICGTIYGVSSWLLGTPFPVVMGLIAGLLDLIPMIGATIAGTILVLATLTQGLTPALIMLVIVLVYQQFENYVLQPTILGKAADVSGLLRDRQRDDLRRAARRDRRGHCRSDHRVDPDRRERADDRAAREDGRAACRRRSAGRLDLIHARGQGRSPGSGYRPVPVASPPSASRYS